VEVVNSIVNKCKDKYGDRFEYYLTGSYVRNEPNYKDYDIAIYDNRNESNDWESLLEMFFNKKEKDGKSIDTQIDQMTRVIMRMNGQTLFENKDERVKRYVYSDKKLENWEYIKYSNLYGNLWEKEIMLVKPKHRKMGLDKIKRMYVKI
tara:strand:+ start:2508 stop:2954 length:447 start_codon:yes stop_codon:yes gene_type:complete